MNGSAPIPAVVLGGSGYVAGELLRLLAGHPSFAVVAIASEGHAGERVEALFPHLRGCFPGLAFVALADAPRALDGVPQAAVFSALPHGHAAAAVDRLLTDAAASGCAARVVDISADFRYADAEAYEAVYRHPHGAPTRLPEFVSALPEHHPGSGKATPLHVGHPGCFTTAVTLATVPLLALGLVEPEISVTAITGSTGAGRTPTATTHHPERRSTLFAYGALAHRHEPEMRALALAATGIEPDLAFVPHAGPFARGIHATLHARLTSERTAQAVREAVAGFYSQAPFVCVESEPPKLQSVVGTNRAVLSFAVRGRRLVAFSVLDNLTKGAAGGAVQWMNRLFDLPETAGLEAAGLGWI